MKRTHLTRRAALTVLATGAIGAAIVTPAAAEVPAATTPTMAAPVSLLDLLPNPLNCLLSTGFAAFCLGVPLS
ncbi:hypothetical protein BJY24_003279 [Nocardia transvalensis]|uniref:Secreted protein n=1 Tax=Nocardia transvalensis TaxID=37333 RepID=A0A7W9PE41_9NOCA|nr:hypothetical protein [Nocardia transvalensis]MBB5914412.1 hypothetical protein [Nocardia transvalensis]